MFASILDFIRQFESLFPESDTPPERVDLILVKPSQMIVPQASSNQISKRFIPIQDVSTGASSVGVNCAAQPHFQLKDWCPSNLKSTAAVTLGLILFVSMMYFRKKHLFKYDNFVKALGYSQQRLNDAWFKFKTKMNEWHQSVMVYPWFPLKAAGKSQGGEDKEICFECVHERLVKLEERLDRLSRHVGLTDPKEGDVEEDSHVLVS